MKTCTRCGALKAPDQFNRQAASRDGVAPACRLCTHARKRELWTIHRDEVNAARRAATPEARLRQKETECARTNVIRAAGLYREDAVRTCTSCGEQKGSTEFALRASRLTGRAAACKACLRDRKQEDDCRRRGGPAKKPLPVPSGMRRCATCKAVRPEDDFQSMRKHGRPGRAPYCRPCWSARSKAFGMTVQGRLIARAASGRRRARKLANAVGKVDLAAIYQRDGGRCHICERLVSLERTHFDHVIPLARGGAHSQDNIRVACRPCNDRKLHRLLTPELRAEIALEVRRLPPPVPNHRLNLIAQVAA